jgi:Cd2+/Zn2+-exporting ATPase
MDCGACAATIEVSLKRLPGVVEATVSFGAGSARVDFDPAQVSEEQLANHIHSLGYSVADRAPTPSHSLLFDITGMDCGDCARTVERMVSALPEVASATVNLGSATMAVVPRSINSPDLMTAVNGAVDRAGYHAVARGQPGLPGQRTMPWWRDRRSALTITAAFLWIFGLTLGLTRAPELFASSAHAIAILIGGLPIARAALGAVRVRRLDMNVLMSVAVIGAVLIGDWSEAAAVVVLFATGGTLQSLTLARTRGAIRALMTLAPPEATVTRGGVEIMIPVASLVVGDLARVLPGGRIPADGRILEGASTVDESAITGESLPVDKYLGAEVFAGTLNGAGTLLLEVSRTAADSTLAKIVHLVEEAQASRAPSQALVDRFAVIYTPLVIAGALVMAITGTLVTGDPREWGYRALVLLVIACPCALVISTPVAIVAAIGTATRLGVLIKGGAALESLGRTRVVAFDKTGTLTLGRPAVVQILPIAGTSEPTLLQLAAAVEQLSEHPLARAVVARALHDAVAIPAATTFTALPGRGARARVGQEQDVRDVVVGSPRLLAELGIATGTISKALDTIASAGQTPLLVAAGPVDGPLSLMGLIAVSDTPRPGVEASIERIRRAGIQRIVVLTGDSHAVGAAVGRITGVDDVQAELLPSEKAEAITSLRAKFGQVVMVGDGINDAPALATADVGIAMGLAGSDIALEAADLALMRDDLGGIAAALSLSRRTTAIIRQNVTISLAVKVVALVLGATGFVNLWVAVAADMGTSLLVTLNGIRLAHIPASD